jgi:sterol desaturase/sphingolipid hydroxylase (fatty acid hydroxylase superfamily)
MLSNLLLTVIAAGIFAEFAGYFIHRLLHSNKVEFLSRAHMIHHLKHYGPKMHQRPSEHYITATQGRASVGNVGLEWILPIGLVAAAVIGTMCLLKIPALYQVIFILVASGWSISMFSYMHDTLHIKGIWLEKNPLLKNSFKHARRLHDIHHMELTDDGRMVKNFGICLFWFDYLFGSVEEEFKGFNKTGYLAALKRYEYIFEEGELRH